MRRVVRDGSSRTVVRTETSSFTRPIQFNIAAVRYGYVRMYRGQRTKSKNSVGTGDEREEKRRGPYSVEVRECGLLSR
jgi:hypothetical protein